MVQVTLGACCELRYTKTQRGRRMLVYDGYKYVENRQSARNTFWRCSRYVKFGCRATIVTSKDPYNVTVRLAGSPHSHEAETRFDDNVTLIDKIIMKENEIKISL